MADTVLRHLRRIGGGRRRQIFRRIAVDVGREHGLILLPRQIARRLQLPCQRDGLRPAALLHGCGQLGKELPPLPICHKISAPVFCSCSLRHLDA